MPPFFGPMVPIHRLWYETPLLRLWEGKKCGDCGFKMRKKAHEPVLSSELFTTIKIFRPIEIE